jgi:hypothetical protein
VVCQCVRVQLLALQNSCSMRLLSPSQDQPGVFHNSLHAFNGNSISPKMLSVPQCLHGVRTSNLFDAKDSAHDLRCYCAAAMWLIFSIKLTKFYSCSVIHICASTQNTVRIREHASNKYCVTYFTLRPCGALSCSPVLLPLLEVSGNGFGCAEPPHCRSSSSVSCIMSVVFTMAVRALAVQVPSSVPSALFIVYACMHRVHIDQNNTVNY